MEIKKATFLGSWEKADTMPTNRLPEFAFIGRSNVGKSSLINMLCNHKGLARISSSPGKTQTLNLYECDKHLHICDLPGYGYAKVSKLKRYGFSKMIEHYLQKRDTLCCLFILIDLRIPPQTLDFDFINWCGENQVPFAIVGTKADKVKPTQLQENIANFQNKMAEVWDELPQFFVSSSENGTGKKELLNFMAECMVPKDLE